MYDEMLNKIDSISIEENMEEDFYSFKNIRFVGNGGMYYKIKLFKGDTSILLRTNSFDEKTLEKWIDITVEIETLVRNIKRINRDIEDEERRISPFYNPMMIEFLEKMRSTLIKNLNKYIEENELRIREMYLLSEYRLDLEKWI